MKPALLAVVILLTSAASASAFVDGRTERTVTVTGRATLEYPPDRAILTAGVLLRGRSPEGLQKELRHTTAKILGFLSGSDIDAADVSSAGVSIDETDWLYDDLDCPKIPDKMKYEGTSSVRIVLRKMEAYDALVRGLFENGATRIDAVTFESSLEEEWGRKARVRAAADASERATDIADGLGQRIGRPLVVSDETRSSRSPLVLSDGLSVSGSGAMADVVEEVAVSFSSPHALAVRKLSVSAEVTVVFELLDKVPTAEPVVPPGSSSRGRESTGHSSQPVSPNTPPGFSSWPVRDIVAGSDR